MGEREGESSVHEGCSAVAFGYKIAALLVVGHTKEAARQYMMKASDTAYLQC